MVLAPSKAESLYITTDIDPETKRDKVIWLKDLDVINININIDLLILYKVHQSLSKGTI